MSDIKPAFYIVREAFRTRHWQMYKGLNLATGSVEDCCMRHGASNGWERLA